MVVNARQPVIGLGKLPNRSGQFAGRHPTRRAFRRFAGVGKCHATAKFRKLNSTTAITFSKFAVGNARKSQEAQLSELRFLINSIA
ncbi:hypothetical protein SAMN06265368_1012 [Cohaesibacter gelatinilyticus]|uniref:Uncharacterized protein n=1 Tax=Cohaesibacter gelatinilyticus TaxID=372072 RepID=A0A285NHY9_9HYPH|nr:hypothetical protein SAMN06265368_1012 [Cohaesibacter gelatinilyticus]